MVSYQITATLDAADAAEFERYMGRQHIPDLMATGCFLAAAFARLAPGRYRMRYDAASAEDLARYQGEHAPRLRAEFAARFPDVTLERDVAQVLETWEGGAR